MKRPYLILSTATLLLAAVSGEVGAQTTIYLKRQVSSECARIGAAFRESGAQLVVVDVTPGSPAAEAGLQRGDRVQAIDGAPASLPRLDTLVQVLHPGKAVSFVVERDAEAHALSIVAAPGLCDPWGQRLTPRVDALMATLERLEAEAGQAQRTLILRLDTARLRQEAARLRLEEITRRPQVVVELEERELLPFHAGAALELGSRSVAGVELSELNPELARYFKGVTGGLLVLRVAPETPGARGGLVPGDVLIQASGEEVRTIGALRAVIARAQGRAVPLEVVRNGKRLRLQLP